MQNDLKKKEEENEVMRKMQKTGFSEKVEIFYDDPRLSEE
jgi:hypothetical protein